MKWRSAKTENIGTISIFNLKSKVFAVIEMFDYSKFWIISEKLATAFLNIRNIKNLYWSQFSNIFRIKIRNGNKKTDKNQDLKKSLKLNRNRHISPKANKNWNELNQKFSFRRPLQWSSKTVKNSCWTRHPFKSYITKWKQNYLPIDPVPSIIAVTVAKALELPWRLGCVPRSADTAVVIKPYGPLTRAPVKNSIPANRKYGFPITKKKIR